MGTEGEKVRVLIATTGGPVEVLLLTEEDPVVGRSVACVGGTTETADIDPAYNAFVARPTGVVERLFEHPCYRLDVSGRLDTGSSWQLGVLTAHALHAAARLAQEGDSAVSVVWATGTVRAVDLTVAAVGHLCEKLATSRERLLQEAKEGHRVIAVVPARNAFELAAPLRAEFASHGIETVEASAVQDLWGRLALKPPKATRRATAARQPATLVGVEADVAGQTSWTGAVDDDPASLRREPPAHAPGRQRRVPFMAPNPPRDFVERPEQMAVLKARLLDGTGGAVALTAALKGAGGFGKSALASQLCHDPDVRRTYVDGILYVELGEKPNNLITRVADLIEVLTGERSGLQTLGALSAKLAEALGEGRYLLVIDDVWRGPDLRPFLQGGPNTTRLVTTRLDHVLPAEAFRVPVDAMHGGEAVTLVAQGFPVRQWRPERPALLKLAARLGEWPLLLTLVNAFLRERSIRDRLPLVQALDDVNRRLDARGLTAFDAKDDAARHQAVARTIGISLELLSEDDRVRFRELAVFPEDTDVPVGICARLWGATAKLDEIDTEDLLQRLVGYSLLLALDLRLRTFRLHDVVRQYLLDTWKTTRSGETLMALHEELIRALGDLGEGSFDNDAERRYAYEHGPRHLGAAGRTDKLATLLLDPKWMQDKLSISSPQSLISDYRSFGNGRAQDLIGRVLDLTAPVLARNPKQLAAQMLARLAPQDADGLDTFLAAASSAMPCPALVPARPTFTAPGAEVRRFEGYGAPLGLAALDGRHVLSCSKDAIVRLLDAERDQELRRFEGHGGAVCAVAVLDPRRFISGSADGTVRLWDIAMGEELRRFEGHEDAVSAVAVLDERRIISGSEDKTVRLWDVETGAELRRFTGHCDAVNGVVAIGGRRVVSGSGRRKGSSVGRGGTDAVSEDWSLRLWDVETGQELRRFHGHESGINAVVALDQRRFVSASTDMTLRLWDAETGDELRRFEGHFNWVMSVAVLDARRVVSGGGDHTIRLWDVETGQQLRRFLGPSGWINSVAALDGRRIVAGANDLRLWDLGMSENLSRLQGHDHWVGAVAVLDNRRLISSSWDKTLRLWDVESGHELRRFEGHSSWVWTVAVLDHRQVISGSADNTLRLWDIETGQELRRFEGHTDKVFGIAALNHRRVVSASSDSTLRLWNVETGEELRRFEGHQDAVCAVVAVDAKRVISGSLDKTLRLWDVETGQELRRYEGHGHTIWKIALFDGRHVISGSFDGTLRLWDVETGDERRRFEGHNAVRSIAVVDARHLISGGHDDTLRLWDIDTGRELARLEGDSAFTALAVLPDRRTIVAGDAIGGLHWIEIKLVFQSAPNS